MACQYLERCTEKQLENIYRELNCTEDSLDRDAKYLMEWLEKEQHLPNIKDENFLKIFLLRCKNSLERTKKSLDSYFTMRYLFPELYTNMNPYNERIKKMIKIAWLVPLPKLTSAGDRIEFYRTFDSEEANDVTVDDFISINLMNFDASVQMSDKFRKLIVIYDFEKLSLTYSATIVEAVRKFISRINGTIINPVRISKVILLNLHPIFHHSLTVIKSLLSKKIADRFELGDTDSVIKFDFLSADVLPSDYGGKLKPLEEIKNDWYESMKTLDWFVDRENLKADLNKKSANSSYKNIDTDDTDGSFRQLLQID